MSSRCEDLCIVCLTVEEEGPVARVKGDQKVLGSGSLRGGDQPRPVGHCFDPMEDGSHWKSGIMRFSFHKVSLAAF